MTTAGENAKKFWVSGLLIGGKLSQKAGFSDWCVIFSVL